MYARSVRQFRIRVVRNQTCLLAFISHISSTRGGVVGVQIAVDVAVAGAGAAAASAGCLLAADDGAAPCYRTRGGTASSSFSSSCCSSCCSICSTGSSSSLVAALIIAARGLRNGSLLPAPSLRCDGFGEELVEAVGLHNRVLGGDLFSCRMVCWKDQQSLRSAALQRESETRSQ